MTSEIQTRTAAAAGQVGGNTDIVEEILVHLPPKSVTRFKLVSKQWLSLISDAQFVHRHSQHIRIHRKFHTGMFVTNSDRICRFADFVSFTDELNPTHQPIPSLGFLYDGIEPPVSEIEIINSCNGLVLCAVSWNSQPFDYCVCNPTTKTLRMLDRKPKALDSPNASAFLAFDPCVSLHYKVICPRLTVSFDTLYLYSSEDQSWKTIPCLYNLSPSSPKGFFLNGSIYYTLYSESAYLCFDFITEVMKRIVLPPPPKNPFSTFLDAFGSHLYILSQENPTPDFRVCEISPYFSMWVTKSNASVGPFLSAFPEIYLKGITVVGGAKAQLVLAIPGKLLMYNLKDNTAGAKPQLVLGIPGKLLTYNLKDNTAKELYNLPGKLGGLDGYKSIKAFQFIETLSAV